jgi:hypothetical protein
MNVDGEPALTWVAVDDPDCITPTARLPPPPVSRMLLVSVDRITNTKQDDAPGMKSGELARALSSPVKSIAFNPLSPATLRLG